MNFNESQISELISLYKFEIKKIMKKESSTSRKPSLKRSMAKTNLNESDDDSFEFVAQLSRKRQRNAHIATSTFIGDVQENIHNASVTFQVDIASTPKRSAPRCSTPKCRKKRLSKPIRTLSGLPNQGLMPSISSWAKLHYPIKFYPNVKSQDINRAFETYGTCVQNKNNCYDHGDYKVWLL